MVEILYNFIESVYAPLIEMGPLYAIAGISITISIILSLAYKALVNQSKVKYIRTELKELKGKMDKAKKKGDEKELKKLFDKSLKLNNEQMMLNMKPLFASMILITLFLPWLRFAYGDINAPLDNNQAIYEYKSAHEEFILNQDNTITQTSTQTEYNEGDKIIINDRTHTIRFNRDEDTGTIESVKFEGFKANLPFSLPIFGNIVGWLGLYIIISMPFTFITRKILNVQ